MDMSDTKEMPFFLLIGQSNIGGRGRMDDLTEEERAPSEGIYNFTHHMEYMPAQHPLQSVDDPIFHSKRPRKLVGGQYEFHSPGVNTVGPGLFFAESIRNKLGFEQLGLLLCARSAIPMPMWLKGINPSLYRYIIHRTNMAMQSGPCLGILIYIGESDARVEKFAQNYHNNLLSFIDCIRKELNARTTPIIISQISCMDEDGPLNQKTDFPYWENIRNIQAEIDLPHVKMVETSGLPKCKDGLHLNTAAHRELGIRFADVMYEMLQEQGEHISKKPKEDIS